MRGSQGVVGRVGMGGRVPGQLAACRSDPPVTMRWGARSPGQPPDGDPGEFHEVLLSCPSWGWVEGSAWPPATPSLQVFHPTLGPLSTSTGPPAEGKLAELLQKNLAETPASLGGCTSVPGDKSQNLAIVAT